MIAATGGPGPHVAVVGGGVAGLAAACSLHEAGIDVTVFESADRPGGVLVSELRDGFLAEGGPNSLAAPPAPVSKLLETIGIADRIEQPLPTARHRYVVRGGRPLPLPMNPLQMLQTDLLSAAGKLRLLREPLVPPARDRPDESVASFVRRRLGSEALDYLAEPFVAGIFAGDPERLSVRHAFPRLQGLELEYGSLFRGALGGRGPGGRSHPPFFSFRGGVAELPRAMAHHLGGRIRTGSTVTGIRRVGGGWYLTGDRNQLDPLRRYDAVVVAVPAYRVNSLAWEGIDAALFRPLGAIRYVPVASLTLGFRRTDVTHPLDGFGMLVPSVEKRRILGTIFGSSLFPNRAPDDHVALTTMVGGARLPGLALAGQTAVRTAVLADLEPLLGITGTPIHESFHCWPRAIPQYDLGYGDVVTAIRAVEAAAPALALVGNYRDGLSVGDTIMTGIAAAERIGALIGGRQRSPA